MVEPSIVKKQRPEPGRMTKEEVCRTKKQRGKWPGTKTRGYVGPWTQARMDGSAWTGPAKGRAKRAEQGGHHRRAKVLFLLKIVSSLLFFSILQMVSHVFMADVGHSGQILSYADSAWSCVGNDMPCLLCC